MNKSRHVLLLVLATSVAALISAACADEIVAGGGDQPLVITTPPSTSSREGGDGGIAMKPGRTPDRLLDASLPLPTILDGAVFDAAFPWDPQNVGCAVVTETEPNNDQSTAEQLGKRSCGILMPADVDAYAGASSNQERTLTFTAVGDAELTLSGFSFTTILRSGESIVVPSFGPTSLPFELTVQSPTGQTQSYRIDFE